MRDTGVGEVCGRRVRWADVGSAGLVGRWDAAGRAADDAHDDDPGGDHGYHAYEGYDSANDRGVGHGDAPMRWCDFPWCTVWWMERVTRRGCYHISVSSEASVRVATKAWG